MGRPRELTPEITEKIVSRIRAGAFPKVAALSTGIGETTFYRWLQFGREKRGKAYWEFWVSVRTAIAEARTVAEARVKKDNPLAWLKSGPGKEDWGDRAEITLLGDAQRPLQVEDNRPAPVQTLAQGYLILQELGIMPKTDPNGQALLASFSDAEPDSAPAEGDDVEGGVPNVLTAAPEWMRRTPGQGRKRGGGGGKKGKGKKGKDKEGGSKPPSGP